MNNIFRIPDGDNLVTYYMLPLVGVNKKTFSKSFKNSYISQDGLRIFVELKSNMQSPNYRNSPCYVTEIVIRDTLFIQFVIPSGYIKDTACFITGKYSEMSRDAKKIIYRTSGLPYNSKMGDFSVSHPLLQALSKTKTLRTFLTNHLDIEISDDDELAEAPHESWFIEHRLKP